MTDINRKDEMNTVVDDSSQFLEDAKARLRWYTLEASEEEFDEEEVDLLVNLIAKLDKSFSVETQDTEQQLERFHAYCNLYWKEEERRKKLKSAKTSETTSVEKKPGRVAKFRRKGMAIAAAAASILLLIIVGSSIGVANAGEDGGFFHWLKRDKEGILAVTSPENVGVSVQENYPNVYNSFEEVPEEYQQYLVRKEDISLLADYELQSVECVEMDLVHRITVVFISDEEQREIRIGILIYEDETMIARDKFEDYKFLYTNVVEEKQQDVYTKEENGVTKYLVSFYRGNRKYFVWGNEDIEFLEAISEEYMDLIYKKE